MTRQADKLLTDIINELQLVRGQLHAIRQRLDEAKVEVVLTVRGQVKRRKRRKPRPLPPSTLIT